MDLPPLSVCNGQVGGGSRLCPLIMMQPESRVQTITIGTANNAMDTSMIRFTAAKSDLGL
jgi:hypothetical protein